MVRGVTAPSMNVDEGESVLYGGTGEERPVPVLAEEGQPSPSVQLVCRGAGEGLEECSATENEGNAHSSQPVSDVDMPSTVATAERQGVSLAVKVKEPTGSSWTVMALGPWQILESRRHGPKACPESRGKLDKRLYHWRSQSTRSLTL